jgi:indolepyruvate ferredoxin oxidoreductase, alpha subunit
VEVSFKKEIEQLRLGAGETFHGEGILAITKALLQSGVSYVGGYQGAPVSHLLDVMVQAKGYMDELGVHVEACSNEASAAAMLGASIHYPLRGAVTWKSIVGTNVAGRERRRTRRGRRRLRRGRIGDSRAHPCLRAQKRHVLA